MLPNWNCSSGWLRRRKPVRTNVPLQLVPTISLAVPTPNAAAPVSSFSSYDR
ncbi:hypothetical protein AB0G04_28675 [Actinoplanes sp. NPDC023801]|uniref:hypothetical protein n=1 Tax=Actinoplanes sp. NPDC023801 TaxID=3154595 RepID=UPI0033EA5ABE